ncbi:hypothetical protein C8Q80DRAFT_1204534 [Daedaleopsis nitida]|nr:hypothetical protein C8Q80DRAFT_1204534 [Daedaleopsis nitida]
MCIIAIIALRQCVFVFVFRWLFHPTVFLAPEVSAHHSQPTWHASLRRPGCSTRAPVLSWGSVDTGSAHQRQRGPPRSGRLTALRRRSTAATSGPGSGTSVPGPSSAYSVFLFSNQLTLS